MRIALVTYQDHGNYHKSGIQNEDDRLIQYLADKNLFLEKTVWNDKEVMWQSFDLVLIKSPWDYFNNINDYYKWLDHLKQINSKALNPINVLRWNADKHYLKDIEKAGLKIVPCTFLPKGMAVQLEDYFDLFNVMEFVVKPVVSGGSKHTFRVNRENVKQLNSTFQPLLHQEDFIIQPFLSQIEQEGEWSFIFFGEKFSHALIKKAKSGDFRVQESYGGTVHFQDPPSEWIAAAAAYVSTFAQGCLYARVDGVFIADTFHLIELELIEPFLFMETAQDRFENYYLALREKIDKGNYSI